MAQIPVISISFNAPIIEQVNVCSEMDLNKAKEDLSMIVIKAVHDAIETKLSEQNG